MAEINERILKLRKDLKLSQTAFGERIGVSRDVIKNIDAHLTQPKPLMIQQICKEFGVNRAWLETGEGEMFVPQTRDEELEEYFNSVLTVDDQNFQKRLISALSKMSVEEWEVLEQLITRLSAREENKKDED